LCSFLKLGVDNGEFPLGKSVAISLTSFGRFGVLNQVQPDSALRLAAKIFSREALLARAVNESGKTVRLANLAARRRGSTAI